MEKFEFEFVEEVPKAIRIRRKSKYRVYFETFLNSSNKIMKINCVDRSRLNRLQNAAYVYRKNNNLDFCIIVRFPYLYFVKA